jgi:hypothetical protein
MCGCGHEDSTGKGTLGPCCGFVNFSSQHLGPAATCMVGRCTLTPPDP